MSLLRALLVAVLLLTAIIVGSSARAADIIALPGNTTIQAPVTSYFGLRFKQVVRQGYDVSCGAAALATLLKFYYGMSITEKEIIEQIFSKSTDEQKKKINAYGFSMLELKHFGESLGFVAGGFKLDSAEKLAKLKVPVLTLITVRGYKHFVVLKGLYQGQVYIADPAFGNRSRPLDRFQNEWDGVILVMVSDRISGRNDFSADGSLSAPAQGVLPLIDKFTPAITRAPTEF